MTKLFGMVLAIVLALFAVSCTDLVTTPTTNTVEKKITTRSADATTAAKIELFGKSPLVLNVGDVYSEPGARVIDVDGTTITTDVAITTDVNTNIPNTWYVLYTYAGYPSVVRKVVVLDAKDTVTYASWNSATPWYEYSVGDRRVDDGKVWECKTIDYSYIKPSSEFGKFGWFLVRTL